MIDLRRVRLAKLPLVTALHADPCNGRKAVMQLSRLDRYEGRAFTRRNRAIHAFVDAAVRRAQIGKTKPTEKGQGFQGESPASSVPAATARTCEGQVGVRGAEPERELAKQSQRRKANDFSKTVASPGPRSETRLRGYRFAARFAYPGYGKYGTRVMRPRPSPMPERAFRPPGAGVGCGKRFAKQTKRK
jgi:hypothetical protein